MQLHRVSSILPLAFVLMACDHSGSTPPPASPDTSSTAMTATPSTASASGANPSDADDDEAVASLKEHHRHHHHGGITTFIAMSVDSLGAEPAKQAKIQKIQADLNERLAPAREAEKALVMSLADGIAAGTIDKTKVDANVAKLSSAATAAHEASIAALNQLHAELSPTERASLADKVKAHWEVWQKVNHQAEAGGREPNGRLSHLTAELSLTPDQVDKISAALKSAMSDSSAKFDPKETEAQIQAFATAFTANSFDAKSLDAGRANGRLATHGANRMALFYETINPLLTPPQRTKLADNLHEHLSHQQVNAAN